MGPWILAAFLFTSAADSASTLYALNHGARESNPIMASMSPPVMIGVKSGLAVGMAFAVGKSSPPMKKPLLITLVGITLLQGLVAVHNVKVVK